MDLNRSIVDAVWALVRSVTQHFYRSLMSRTSDEQQWTVDNPPPRRAAGAEKRRPGRRQIPGHVTGVEAYVAHPAVFTCTILTVQRD